MSIWIDVKYLNLVSSKLSFFKKKGDNLWNFRCPVCGDSEKKKSKARGYVYKKGNDLYYRCHNCTFGTTLSKFIERIDPHIHKEYVKERFLAGEKGTHNYKKPVLFSPPKFSNKKKINLQTVAELEEEHWVKKYVYNRNIPIDFHNLLYYSPDFKNFVEEIGSPKAKDLKEDDPRLVIPFFDEEGNLFAFQGRALTDSKIRYISIKLNTEASLIYGLDRVNKEIPVYVVEGPIDSMFIKNSIAAAGSDLSRVLSIIPDPIFVFDNEPRNKDICKIMDKAIEEHFQICIWPEMVKEKDINEMILAGFTAEELVDIIDKNTFVNLRAKFEFIQWKKI